MKEEGPRSIPFHCLAPFSLPSNLGYIGCNKILNYLMTVLSIQSIKVSSYDLKS